MFENARDDHRDHAKRRVLREDQQHAHRRRHRRKRQARDARSMSISAEQVLALDDQRATPPSPGCVSTLVVTPSMIDCACAVDGARPARRASAAGCRRPSAGTACAAASARGSSKVSSKPLCVSPEPSSTLARTSASTTSRGAVSGTRTDPQGELDAAQHDDRLSMPGGAGIAIRAPSVSVSSNGSVTTLASAMRQ